MIERRPLLGKGWRANRSSISLISTILLITLLQTASAEQVSPKYLNHYSVDSQSITYAKHSVTFALLRDESPDYGDDPVKPTESNPEVRRLRASVVAEHDHRIHIKISDAEKSRWEIPFSTQDFSDLDQDFLLTFQRYPIKVTGFNFTQDRFSLTLEDRDSGSAIASTKDTYFRFLDKYIVMELRMDGTRVMGLGERVANISLRSGNYTLFPRDQGTPVETRANPGKNLYGMHPFLLYQTSSGLFAGAYLRTSNAMQVNLRQSAGESIARFSVVGGMIDLYLFYKGQAQYILQQYHEIIGKPPLPPLWALGYHHGKSGLAGIDELKSLVNNFTSHGVPLDALWTDIELLDDGKNFVVDKDKFPGLGEYVQGELHSRGINFVPIIEPGLKADENYSYFNESAELKCLVKNSSGDVHLGKSRAGHIGYPNFHHPKMEPIWIKGVKSYAAATNADGFWLNNNEFSNLCNGECKDSAASDTLRPEGPYDKLPFTPGDTPLNTRTLSMSADYRWKEPGQQPFNFEFNLHSLNSLMMANATSLGVPNNNKRVFLASRSTFPGIQKFAVAHWLGETPSSWEHLKHSLSQLSLFQAFGIPVVGSVVGGNMGDTEEELYSRWMQLGLLYPLSLGFKSAGSRACDPFSYSARARELSINAIRTKYSLLMYIYTTIFEQSLMGTAAIQPLFFEFPDDEMAFRASDRVLLYGKGLMITAPFEARHKTYPVYFPNSNWFSLHSGELVLGHKLNATTGRILQSEASSEHPNIFVRGGTILPFQDAIRMKVRNVQELKKIPSTLIVALNEKDQASGRLAVDDGYSADTIASKKYRHYSFQFSNKTLKVMMLEGYEYKQEPYDSEKFERIEIWGATRFKNITSACLISNMMSRRGLKFSYDETRNVLVVYDTSRRKLSWSTIEAIAVFANDDYNFCMGGFVATKIKITDELRRMTALLETGFDLSERKYQMEAILLNDMILNLKISPTNWKAWEVPGVVDAKFRNSTTGKIAFAEYLFAISTDPDPFFFAVTNPGDPEDTTITTQNMPIVLNERYVEVPTLVKTTGVFGLGERCFPKFQLKPGRYTIFTHDAISPMEDGEAPGKNMYGHHPFYLFRMPDNKYGAVFVLSSNAMDISILPFDETMYQINHIISGGIIDMFIIQKGTPKSIIEQYHRIIGRPHVLPYWAFGNHQARYGYHTQLRLKDVVDKYLNAKIPLDGIWTDIDYMDSLVPFTLDKKRYPSMHEFVKWVHEKNVKFIPIVEAAIAINTPNPAYTKGLEYRAFISSGNEHGKYWHVVGIVWPGYATFVDFHHPNATQYWVEMLEYLNDELMPFDGIWLDMDEVTTFCDGECDFNGPHRKPLDIGSPRYLDLPYIPGHRNMQMKALPLHAQHYSPSPEEKHNYIQYNLHTMWAHMQIKATNAYFQKHRLRPFIIARSTFPSTGRYGSHWLGDNKSKWEFLSISIVGLYNFHMFGVPFTGADICGFNGNTTMELCRRWYQLGAFYPFCRNHNDINTVDQEPYVDEDLAKTARMALQLRYSLIRYMYTLHMLSSRNGGGYFVPVFFEFPDDLKATENPELTFMLGRALKVTPVMTEGASEVTTYFPNENWFMLGTGKKDVDFVEGKKEGVTLKLSAPLSEETINVHIRGGAVIPYQDAIHSHVMNTHDLRLLHTGFIIAPNHQDKAEGFVLFDADEDLDGSSSSLFNLTYEKARLSFSYTSDRPRSIGPKQHRDEYLGETILYNAGIYAKVRYACANLHTGEKVRLDTTYDQKYKKLIMKPVQSVPIMNIHSIIWNDEHITC